MNYREKMREYILCPQFGSIDYGKWGSLNLEQRKLIKKLLDEMDRADEVIKKQFVELNKQKEVLDKIKEYTDKLIAEANMFAGDDIDYYMNYEYSVRDIVEYKKILEEIE